MSVLSTKSANAGTGRISSISLARAGSVLGTALIVAFQLLGLWALYLAGVWAVAMLELPVPGNLVGLVTLYGLLTLGIVRTAWFEPLSSAVIKHLAFFFIPVTVGLMDVAGLLLSHALAIVVALSASAAIGILLAGLVSQTLIDRNPHRRG